MKPVLWIPTSCSLILSCLLSSCGNNSGSSGPQAVTGPYDRHGNYVEAWADDPSKWRKSGGGSSPHELKTDDIPQIAKIDQPPQDSVPIPTRTVSKPAPVIAQTKVTSTPKPATRTSEPVVVKSTPSPVKTQTAGKAKPKPKPVAAAKTKAKPKPKSVRYVVKKGDSLSAIASRTGSSVSAIKSANGISGTIIRPGQSLTIPKR